MGLRDHYIHFIENSVKQVYTTTTELWMLELGNQRFSTDFPRLGMRRGNTGKTYFTGKKYNHVSVDLNGKYGSLVRDLRDTSQFEEWHNKFNVLTNIGTTEHVEPIEKQFECFSIIHNTVMTGGVMIHLVPDIDQLDLYGHWRKHCNVFYSEEFFKLLSLECDYKILDNTVINRLRAVALQKKSSQPFMEDRNLFLSQLTEKDFKLHVSYRQ